VVYASAARSPPAGQGAFGLPGLGLTSEGPGPGGTAAVGWVSTLEGSAVLTSTASLPSGDASALPSAAGPSVGLKASMIARGSPALVGCPVFRLTRTSLMPSGSRNGIGGWSASAIWK